MLRLSDHILEAPYISCFFKSRVRLTTGVLFIEILELNNYIVKIKIVERVAIRNIIFSANGAKTRTFSWILQKEDELNLKL